jgi:F-type H+-transporting ATPase subunit delta
MRQPKVALRYAKALFDLAVETSQLEIVKKDLENIVSNTTDDLRTVMMSPVITGDKKEKIFSAVFGEHVSKLTVSFFNLLFRKGREVAVKEINAAFDQMYRDHHNIHIVEITTAAPVDENVNSYLTGKLKARPRYQGADLQVTNKVDSDIIGGFILQVGDLLYDASIRHDLAVIKKQFIENMYVQKLR